MGQPSPSDGATALEKASAAAVAKLNSEGRAVVTYHKHFALINVYAPTSSRQRVYGRLPFKQLFHEALVGLTADIKSRGIHVVIAGDLNVSYRAVDLDISSTVISLDDLEGMLPAPSGSALHRVGAALPAVRAALATVKVERVSNADAKRQLWGARFDAYAGVAPGCNTRLQKLRHT